MNKPDKTADRPDQDSATSPFDLNRTQRTALESLLKANELPRSRLAEICGVSAPAITRIARELIARELVLVAGKGNNTRGQPSTNLAINPEGAFALGVFIERDTLSFTLINFIGEVVATDRVSGTFDQPQTSLPVLFEHLDRFIQDNIPRMNRIVGLGIAVTGNFVIDGHTVVPPKDMEHWKDLDFATLFRARYSFPIVVENDGSAAALGEQLTGQGQTYKTFFYVHMANGLGGGYILNGKLIRGAHGNASELGHLLQAPKTRPTLRSLAETLKRPLGDITFEEIETMFNRKDKAFFRWLDKAIDNLKLSINAVAVLMDPEAIVFGGRFPPIVTNYIIENVPLTDYGKYWDAVARPDLVPAKNFSADAAVYGAAALPLYEILLSSD